MDMYPTRRCSLSYTYVAFCGIAHQTLVWNRLHFVDELTKVESMKLFLFFFNYFQHRWKAARRGTTCTTPAFQLNSKWPPKSADKAILYAK